jgi:arginine decarboxylase
LIALAAMDDEDGFIVCNGYKDFAYIETALVAQRFDNTVIVVLERIEELDIVLRAAEELGIRPMIGVRAKLAARAWAWADSAGDRAKFGLTTSEMVEVVDELAEARHARLPAAPALPHRQPDQQHHPGQERHARGGPDLHASS